MVKTTRREFLKGAAVAGAAIAGLPGALEAAEKTLGSGKSRVVIAKDSAVMSRSGNVSASVLDRMLSRCLAKLTGEPNGVDGWKKLFSPNDIVGIKVNCLFGKGVSTRPEVADAIARGLMSAGVKPSNIIIWDRFDYMLTAAGFTPERFPGVAIEGLQTMDEAAAEGKTNDNSKWLRPDGSHVSAPNFDLDAFFWADVEGPKDLAYLNQHVFNGKYSYFGKLVTRKLTKIINLPAFKNTGNAISMATKNIGYGSVCNTNRLHRPMFLDVCVEVPAFPAIRDKMVLNITDGLRSQYDGGPDSNAKFIYIDNRLYFATDPFALDMVCHTRLTAKRKEMGVAVNENPRFTDYLRYAEKLGLGVADPAKIKHVRV